MQLFVLTAELKQGLWSCCYQASVKEEWLQLNTSSGFLLESTANLELSVPPNCDPYVVRDELLSAVI